MVSWNCALCSCTTLKNSPLFVSLRCDALPLTSLSMPSSRVDGFIEAPLGRKQPSQIDSPLTAFVSPAKHVSSQPRYRYVQSHVCAAAESACNILTHQNVCMLSHLLSILLHERAFLHHQAAYLASVQSNFNHSPMLLCPKTMSCCVLNSNEMQPRRVKPTWLNYQSLHDAHNQRHSLTCSPQIVLYLQQGCMVW